MKSYFIWSAFYSIIQMDNVTGLLQYINPQFILYTVHMSYVGLIWTALFNV